MRIDYQLGRIAIALVKIAVYALPLSFEMLGFSVDLLWHTKSDRAPAHQLLRNFIAQLCPKSDEIETS
ncbi:hypothetical protein [Chlorogloeopsis sp. ULAP02]|uniref:hypothetical protein n=1 Tax=Chlorogloeopsis sp. ULAP02 TaxID=3107926 RepID=UPI0031352619